MNNEFVGMTQNIKPMRPQSVNTVSNVNKKMNVKF